MPDRYKITTIGAIEMGIDGADQYLLVRDLEQELDPLHLVPLLAKRYFSQCTRPGGYFCDTPRIIPDPIHKDRCIAVVQHRYDV